MRGLLFLKEKSSLAIDIIDHSKTYAKESCSQMKVIWILGLVSVSADWRVSETPLSNSSPFHSARPRWNCAAQWCHLRPVEHQWLCHAGQHPSLLTEEGSGVGSSHVVVKMTAFVTYRHDTDIFLSPATPCVTVTLVLSSLVLYVFLLCHWVENGNYQLK